MEVDEVAVVEQTHDPVVLRLNVQDVVVELLFEAVPAKLDRLEDLLAYNRS